MSYIPEDLRGDGIIDSRDIIKRLDWLQGSIDDMFNDWKEQEAGDEQDDDKLWEDFIADMCGDPEVDEYVALKAVDQDGRKATSEWQSGVSLVRDDYFEEYARHYAEDLGYIKRDVSWPYNHIDWEAAAEDLKSDYTSIDFDADEYWVQST